MRQELIDRRAASERAGFLAAYRLQRPVVLTGGLALWSDTLLDLDRLASRFGAAPVLTYRVPAPARMSATNERFYLWTDDEGAQEHLRQWTFGEFIAALQAGEPHYCMANRVKNRKLRDLLAAEAGELECARAVGERPGPAGREFFIGSEGIGPGLHHDGAVESFLCQLSGVKRVNVFSPADIPYLYPVASGQEPQSHFSRVADSFHVDAAAFPLFHRATAHQCELQPGEILYLPPHWYHDPCPMGANAMMSVRCDPPGARAS